MLISMVTTILGHFICIFYQNCQLFVINLDHLYKQKKNEKLTRTEIRSEPGRACLRHAV